MAVVVEVDDPVVYLLAYGQPYAATVVATNGADPPVLTLKYEDRTVAGVRYNATAQAPNTWCRYTDPGRPGTLVNPDQVIAPPVLLTEAAAEATYLTKAQADLLYAAIAHEHA